MTDVILSGPTASEISIFNRTYVASDSSSTSVSETSIEERKLPDEKSLSQEKPIRVMILSHYGDTLQSYERQSKGQNRWGRIQLVDQGPADYYILFNYWNHELPSPDRIIYLQAEPDQYPEAWRQGWQHWRPDRYAIYHTLIPWCGHWWSTKTYPQLVDELKNCEVIEKGKTGLISAIVSSHFTLPGHQKRVLFLKYVQSQGFPIDIYGRDNKFGLYPHKGPASTKDMVHYPYKYSFVSENCSEPNYFTEKLMDCLFGECLPLYWGCSNIQELIDPEAVILLDLNDFPKSLQIMKDAIANHEWEKRLPAIRRAKEQILHRYNLFPRLERLLVEGPRIHLIGDGHIWSFRGMEKVDFHFTGPIRLHNVNEGFLENQNFDLLNENDYAVFSYGELDIRCTLDPLAPDDYLQEVISNYVGRIKAFCQIQKLRPLIYNVTAPILAETAPEFVPRSDLPNRSRLTKRFNRILSQTCEEQGLFFLRTPSKYVDEKGCLRRVFSHGTMIHPQHNEDLVKALQHILSTEK